MKTFIRSPKPPEADVPGDALAGVPDVYSDPGVVAAQSRLEHFRTELRRVEGALSDARDYPGDTGQAAASVETDVSRLLEGAAVDDLAETPTAEGRRTTLARQLTALRKAVPAGELAVRQAVVAAQQDLLHKLEPMLSQRRGRLTAVEQALADELGAYSEFMDGLARKGLSGLIMSEWDLTTAERQLLFGGDQPSLQTMLESREARKGK